MLRKVKLADLEQNPWRDYVGYKIRDDKVAQLMESIRETGFWPNLVGREKDGKIQLAYGHHRLDALRKLFPPEAEIEITVKNLSDGTMAKMMGRENAEEWNCPIAATDDAVKAAREYLKANPGEIKELLTSLGNEVKRSRVGAPAIAAFLGKSVGAVASSLERLNLIESGKVKREALYLLPSAAAAEGLAKAISEMPIKLDDQKLVAE